MAVLITAIVAAVLVYFLRKVQRAEAAKRPVVKEPVTLNLSSLALKTQYALDSFIYKATQDRKLEEITLTFTRSADEVTVEDYRAHFKESTETVLPQLAQEQAQDLAILLREERTGWQQAVVTIEAGPRSTHVTVAFSE